MHYMLKTISNTKQNVYKLKSIENVLQRSYRVNRPERSSLIKAAVVGSGSFGDPAALLVKTCDGFMCV